MKLKLIGITDKRTYTVKEVAIMKDDLVLWKGDLFALKKLLDTNITTLVGDLGRRFENHFGEKGIVVGLEYRQKTVVYKVKIHGHDFPTLIFRDKIRKWITEPTSWEAGTPQTEDLTEVVDQQQQTIRDLEREVSILQEKLQELQNRESALDKQGELFSPWEHERVSTVTSALLREAFPNKEINQSLQLAGNSVVIDEILRFIRDQGEIRESFLTEERFSEGTSLVWKLPILLKYFPEVEVNTPLIISGDREIVDFLERCLLENTLVETTRSQAAGTPKKVTLSSEVITEMEIILQAAYQDIKVHEEKLWTIIVLKQLLDVIAEGSETHWSDANNASSLNNQQTSYQKNVQKHEVLRSEKLGDLHIWVDDKSEQLHIECGFANRITHVPYDEIAKQERPALGQKKSLWERFKAFLEEFQMF